MVRGAGRLLWLVLALGLATPAAAQQPQPPVELDDPTGPTPPDATIPSRTIPTNGADPSDPTAAVLTIDQERLYAESAWGRRALRELEEQGARIADENERQAAQLSEEEAELTRQRTALDPAEFRRRAEAFDSRATAVRRERAQAVQDLNAAADADRAAFYQAALPIMGEVMQDRGAVAVLDRRTVFISLDAIDITSDLIRRLDASLGDGAGRQKPAPGAATALPAGD
ncbi:OmpH family outer membrane protein [Paracoccus spongiarum]|uniref:OmpH family outer membrane protein n=1 Tax=Paracoccus spongiarum TaxID=3064387 RepID=A0ABT9JDK7_9RHOB|nr:OmpH family outer membrane protein [Paracoccus sp. 2205BS29-5]MDP5307790.1 OmpH family outer membrane protein [Paracoccus sp. 2205BS29-5]